MNNVNMVLLGGRVGGLPEEKKLPSGKSLTTFRLAHSRWDTKTSAEVTDWYTVVLWDREAERCAKVLQRGASVLVEGRVNLKEWADKDGQKRERCEINAYRVNLVAFAKREGDDGGRSTSAPSPVAGPSERGAEVPF